MVRITEKLKRIVSLTMFSILALMFVSPMPMTAATADSLVICHSGSDKNYNALGISPSAVISAGHTGHEYDVFPPFWYNGILYPGSNWDDTGRDIWLNSCGISNPKEFDVSYDGNGFTGGTVPDDTNVYAKNEIVTVLGPGTMVKFGYTFNGWNTAQDGSGISYSAGQTFSITSNKLFYAVWILNPNNTPIANPQSVTTDEDTSKSITLTGTDADGDSLTYAIETQPTNGVLTGSGNIWTYTPTPDYNGSDSFTFNVNDGTATSTPATVSILVSPVNDPPEITTTPGNSAVEDVQYSYNADATDPDGDTLNWSVGSTDTCGGVIDPVTGVYTFTIVHQNPPTTCNLHIIVNDGNGGSDFQTASINITSVNDAPQAKDDTYVTPEDTTLVVPLPGVLANDSDPDSAFEYVYNSAPAHGSVEMHVGDSFTYIPDTNYYGPDSFTYTIVDVYDMITTDTATVYLSVTPVDDPPVAIDDFYSINEDNTLYVDIPGPLTNDTDIDGGIPMICDHTDPAHGIVSFGPAYEMVYIPNENYHGMDVFTYELCDTSNTYVTSTGTITITVIPVNDVPVAVDDSYSINEDVPLNVAWTAGVRVNDYDNDVDALSAELVSGPLHGALNFYSDGSFSYIPVSNYHGLDNFSYKVNDGTVDSNVAIVNITVNPINDLPDIYSIPPQPAVEDVTYYYQAMATDLDGDTLSWSIDSGNSCGGTIDPVTGVYSFTPSGPIPPTSCALSILVSDGHGGIDTQAEVINIAAVNDGPVANPDFYVTEEDKSLTIILPGVLANDIDPDSLVLVSTNTTPLHGTAYVDMTGGLFYTPNANFYGVDTFTYTVFDVVDPTKTSSATVTITVEPANDPPVAKNDSTSIDEDSVLNVSVPGVRGNDYDVDGDPMTAILVSNVSHGTLSLNPNGSYSYTPLPNFFGNDTFTYKMNDGVADSNVATVTIRVNPVNDKPVALADSYSVNNNTTLVVPVPGVLANDTDIDSALLTAEIETYPAHGMLTFYTDGHFNYYPDSNFKGVDYFTYRAYDSALYSEVVTVSISVSDVTPPTITMIPPDPFYVELGQAYTDPGATAYDLVDGDITSQIVTSNTVNANALGTYTVTYNVSDSSGNAATPVVRTVVVDDNTAPQMPALIYPYDNSILNSGVNIPLDWTTVTDPSGVYYRYDLWKNGMAYATGIDTNVSHAFVTLADGVYNWRVMAFDGAFNQTPWTGWWTFTVDTTPPAPEYISPTPADDSRLNGDGFEVRVDGDDATSCRIYLNDGEPLEMLEDEDESFYYVFDGLRDGTYDYYVVCRDQAGNEGSTGERSVILNNNPPVITLNGLAIIQAILGREFTDPWATAMDDEDGDISDRIVRNLAPNVNVLGEYVLTYNVSDSNGNPAKEVTRIVRIIPDPEITPYTAPTTTPVTVTPVVATATDTPAVAAAEEEEPAVEEEKTVDLPEVKAAVDDPKDEEDVCPWWWIVGLILVLVLAGYSLLLKAMNKDYFLRKYYLVWPPLAAVIAWIFHYFLHQGHKATVWCDWYWLVMLVIGGLGMLLYWFLLGRDNEDNKQK